MDHCSGDRDCWEEQQVCNDYWHALGLMVPLYVVEQVQRGTKKSSEDGTSPTE